MKAMRFEVLGFRDKISIFEKSYNADLCRPHTGVTMVFTVHTYGGPDSVCNSR